MIKDLHTASEVLLTSLRMLAAGGCGPGFPLVSSRSPVQLSCAHRYARQVSVASPYHTLVQSILVCYTLRRNPVKRKSNLRFSKNVQTVCGPQSASYSVGTGAIFPGLKRSES
jgi:hypothetical protein